MIYKRTWICLVAMIPLIAHAQFDWGGGTTSNPSTSNKPWTEFKLNTKTKIRLEFKNSGVDAILSMYQKTSGITIVKDPALTGQMTLTSAKAVTISEAFSILSTTLSLKGFEIVKEDNLLIVRQKKQQPARDNMPSFDPSIFAGGGGQEKSVLKFYPIKYANASQLARVINDVFADSGNNSNPFAQFGGGGGGFGGPGGFNRGGAGGAGGRNNGGNFQNFARAFGRNQSTSNVKASSDDFSNSLIINAPEKEQGQVRDLIKQLDNNTDAPVHSRVFKLQYAVASDLVSVVQNVLNSNVPRGRGGASTQQTQGPQAFINAIRGQNAGSGQVAADTRTNTLVVTATDENMMTVEKVIADLDKDVPVQTTTFVVTLNNAKADAVAKLIQQAFGNRQGSGVTNSTFNSTTSTAARPNNGVSNNSNTSSGRALGGSIPNEQTLAQAAKDLELQMQDPNATSGDLLTSIGVTQGFGGQFFGGGQNRNTGSGSSSTTQQTGRDSNGKLVNVRDLTGQVTAIPDINTNSLIIVTAPENAAIIRSILEQLDHIPEQVLIETVIVEATLDASTKLGVEWSLANNTTNPAGGVTSTANTGTDFQLKNPPANTNPLTGFKYTLSGKSFSLSGKSFSAFANALQSDSRYQVLSTPKIFTSNNVVATINISQSIPYITSNRIDPQTGATTSTYAFQPVGIILTVTPRITSNGYVTMEVTQTANDLQGYSSFNAPIVNQREAETTVSVKDGETVILGGIIRKLVSTTNNRVPILGDIPILGQLFRSTSKQNTKTELLVFLTPRIIRDPDEARKMTEDQQKKLSPETQKRLIETIGGGTVPPTKGNGGN